MNGSGSSSPSLGGEISSGKRESAKALALSRHGFKGVRSAGRLIVSSCTILDMAQVWAQWAQDRDETEDSHSPSRKLELAQGCLQNPAVEWTLVASTTLALDLGVVEARTLIRLDNVTGRGKEQVRFTASIDTIDGKNTKIVTAKCVHSDGLIGELSHIFGKQVKLKIHIAVQDGGVSGESLFEHLSCDLARLLDEDVLTDVVLKVKGDETNKRTDIRAHKAVLAARSPFFQGLFMSDMAENRTSTVSVDFPAPVMELLVRFAYTGQLDVVTGETAMSLLGAADYYQLSDLKRLCEKRLLVGVDLIRSREQVLHTLVLADRYGARELKDAALNVAADRLKTLQQQPEWVEFAKNHHDLVTELVGVVADKMGELAKQADELLDKLLAAKANVSEIGVSEFSDVE